MLAQRLRVGKGDTNELSSIGRRRSDFGGGSVKFFLKLNTEKPTFVFLRSFYSLLLFKKVFSTFPPISYKFKCPEDQVEIFNPPRRLLPTLHFTLSVHPNLSAEPTPFDPTLVVCTKN